MATERADIAVFPALTRAKQRFLERRATASTSRNASSVPVTQAHEATAAAERESVQTASLEPVLLGFCRDLDDDLHAIARDVDAIGASVRQSHQRLCLDLDTLTTSLIDSQLVFPPTEPSPRHKTHPKKPSSGGKTKKIVVVPRRLHQHHRQSSVLQPKSRSRVTKLALQAVHAHVIQHHIRFFFYRHLYPGGQQQFIAARQLSKRSSLAHTWRRWTQLINQRQRLKRRFVKLASRLNTRLVATNFCALEATHVLENDGKYAMAKRFYELKTLAKAYHTWLNFVY